MPSVSLIVIAAFLILGGVIALLWRNSRNTASILIVVGIVIAAGIATAVQVDHYRSRQAEADAGDAARAVVDLPLPPPAMQNAPAMRGLTGGAAPPAARGPDAKS